MKYDPAQPLKNRRWEAFCRHIAAGSAQGPAWTKAGVETGKKVSGNANAAKAAANKVIQNPAVAARIRFLKAERDKAAQQIELPDVTKETVAMLASECIVVLEETYKRCLSDPGATHPQRERLLQTLSQHLARTAKYTDDAEVDDAEMATTARRVTDRLLTWHDCQCGGGHD